RLRHGPSRRCRQRAPVRRCVRRVCHGHPGARRPPRSRCALLARRRRSRPEGRDRHAASALEPSMKLALIAIAASVLSCSAESAPVTARKALPPGVAASVGGDLVDVRTIESIANARGVDRSHARELAVRDALFAAAVRANPDRAANVVVAERATLGRVVLESFAKEAESAGPPTDGELGELTAERWTELDRPSSVRTTHAVVLVKTPEDAAPARALAGRLAAALRGITASAEFIERAQAFPTAPLELRA